MSDQLYLKDDQIKDFIEKIFYAYRETYSDPKEILKKYSFGTAHHRAIHLIERYEGLTISDLLNKLKITKQSLNRVLRDLIKGIKIVERKIKPEEIENFEGCFLTGTAAEVTPVSQIDKYKFTVCNVIKDLSESYQVLVRKKTAA